MLLDQVETPMVCGLCTREIEHIDNEWQHIENGIQHTAIPQKDEDKLLAAVGRRYVDGIWTEYLIKGD